MISAISTAKDCPWVSSYVATTGEEDRWLSIEALA
jgi:hypothetical protein